MSKKSETKSPTESNPINAEDQKKLNQIKELQAELNKAFKDAKNYTGESKEDKAVFEKIKTILDKIAKLTKS